MPARSCFINKNGQRLGFVDQLEKFLVCVAGDALAWNLKDLCNILEEEAAYKFVKSIWLIVYLAQLCCVKYPFSFSFLNRPIC